VVATVKNEGRAVDRLLQSLCEQSRQPDEVIIVDGGSQDDTLDRLHFWEALHQLPLRVVVEPGCNISRGRNLAIAAASGPIIASTDSGVRLDPSWLKSLLLPFERSDLSPLTVASGFFCADASSAFEVAMGATVLPALADVKTAKFLPSSRSVAYPKTAWETVGGYPEWLDYCEDLVFDLRLRASGYSFVFVPDAVARFRPRGSLGSFFKQYYRYARGDGKAALWQKRHALRYAAYCLALPLLLWLCWTKDWRWCMLLLLGAVAMLWTPYKRLIPAMRKLGVVDRLRALIWVPIIRITGDIAKMIGYPVGLFWRWRHRGQLPVWRHYNSPAEPSD
jgi:glycosyltransferase involved in cell wall biosynthesis